MGRFCLGIWRGIVFYMDIGKVYLIAWVGGTRLFISGEARSLVAGLVWGICMRGHV